MLTALWCYKKEKSGRKTPSKGDITFTEAEDSAMAESQYVAELSTPVVGNEDSVQSPATCSDADAFTVKNVGAVWVPHGAVRCRWGAIEVPSGATRCLVGGYGAIWHLPNGTPLNGASSDT